MGLRREASRRINLSRVRGRSGSPLGKTQPNYAANPEYEASVRSRSFSFGGPLLSRWGETRRYHSSKEDDAAPPTRPVSTFLRIVGSLFKEMITRKEDA